MSQEIRHKNALPFLVRYLIIFFMLSDCFSLSKLEIVFETFSVFYYIEQQIEFEKVQKGNFSVLPSKNSLFNRRPSSNKLENFHFDDVEIEFVLALTSLKAESFDLLTVKVLKSRPLMTGAVWGKFSCAGNSGRNPKIWTFRFRDFNFHITRESRVNQIQFTHIEWLISPTLSMWYFDSTLRGLTFTDTYTLDRFDRHETLTGQDMKRRRRDHRLDTHLEYCFT